MMGVKAIAPYAREGGGGKGGIAIASYTGGGGGGDMFTAPQPPMSA